MIILDRWINKRIALDCKMYFIFNDEFSPDLIFFE